MTLGTTDDDIVLEVIVLLGTVAVDPNGALLLMESGIIDKLINILSGTVLHKTFFKFFMNTVSRNVHCFLS